MTKYEFQIYNLVNESRNHMTAEQVFDQLKESSPSVSLATVYNNLNKLCSAELIRRISLEGQPDRYDRTARHDHLICKECGRLSDVQFKDLTSPLQKELGDNFLSYDLKIYYICPECKELAARRSN